ncbi:MAG: NADH-quinone oxidoreductase subunit D, partial [Deltaproteobacteria bacterium]|nr:NADH-quinone oxidoreductase subunit D [Deltaproteobacteria bacterium]
FDVPVGENGDCFDRYILRIEEMRQAARIIKQALEQMPDGRSCIDMPDVVPPPRKDIETNMESLIHHFKLVSNGFKAPKGELGFYIISDGSERPFRVKIRAPSFVNLQAVDPMCKDVYLADVVAVVSSLDPVFGEADK